MGGLAQAGDDVPGQTFFRQVRTTLTVERICDRDMERLGRDFHPVRRYERECHPFRAQQGCRAADGRCVREPALLGGLWVHLHAQRIRHGLCGQRDISVTFLNFHRADVRHPGSFDVILVAARELGTDRQPTGRYAEPALAVASLLRRSLERRDPCRLNAADDREQDEAADETEQGRNLHL